MTATPERSMQPKPPESARSQLAIPAWITFGTLLVLEYLTISYLFDARTLLAPANLATPLEGAGNVLPLLFVVAIATLITGGHDVARALETLSHYEHSRSRIALQWLIHAGLFFSTLLLGFALSQGQLGGLPPQLAVGLWLLLVTASIASCALCFWTLHTIPRALHSVRRGLTIGAGVGLFAWLAALGAQFLWEPLTWLTLELVHAALTLIVHDPVASMADKLVGTERFFVTIAPVCSGVEGLGLMLAFMSAFLYLKRDELRWPISFLLLPLTLLAIWLLNLVRITALICVGTWLSEDVALGGFHSKAGWVLFTLAALASVRLAQNSPRFSKRPDSPSASAPTRDSLRPAPDHATTSPEVAFLFPLLAVLGVSLISGLATSGFDLFYPLRVLVGGALLFKFRELYPSLRVERWWPGLLTGLGLAVFWIVAFQAPEKAPITDLGDELEALPVLWAGVWLVFRVIGTTITIPVIEELAFRGYLMRRFKSANFEELSFRDVGWLPLLGSSLAFGALHSQWLLGLLAGLVFGALVIIRGRLSDAILAHAVTNSALVIYVLASRNWAILG